MKRSYKALDIRVRLGICDCTKNSHFEKGRGDSHVPSSEGRVIEVLTEVLAVGNCDEDRAGCQPSQQSERLKKQEYAVLRLNECRDVLGGYIVLEDGAASAALEVEDYLLNIEDCR